MAKTGRLKRPRGLKCRPLGIALSRAGRKLLYSLLAGTYSAAMQPHSGWGRKWRRFRRKNRLALLASFLIVVVVALVGLLMYLLTSMSWPVHD